MPRKASRGRRPQSRRGGGIITWLIVILLIAVIVLLAMPYLQRTTPAPTDTGEGPTGEHRAPRDTGDGEAGTQPSAVPGDEATRPRPAPPSAADNQEANEVAAEISQGVVSYDRAVRNQQEAAPKPAEPGQH